MKFMLKYVAYFIKDLSNQYRKILSTKNPLTQRVFLLSFTSV